MENVRNFLESSTIHGLAYIATGRKYVRLFWTLVVIAGFTGAGYMIYESFQSWADSPVKTTIETLPISEITFPKVTVCPPKNTYTDLNYDLMMVENMTLDNDTRNELRNYAVELLYDHLYDDMMANLSKLEDKYRYYNWYHGYSGISLPYYSSGLGRVWSVYNTASSGTISTQYFGEEFDAEKVETHLYYTVKVFLPDSVRNNPNVSLHFDIEKLSMKDLPSGGINTFGLSGSRFLIFIDDDITHVSQNYTPLANTIPSYYIEIRRKVFPRDVTQQKLQMMPGFRLTWHYSGMKVESEARYVNKAFVR